MAVAETKVKISLIDAMSKNLQGIYGEMNKLDNAAERMRTSFSSAFTAGAGIAAGMVGINSITDALGTAAQKAWDFSMNMETNRIGMAGILSSMTQLNGKALQWNDALAISANLIDRMNTEALRTATTSEELVNTFRALLGPGLSAGMDLSQIQQLTTVGVNAVKSLGLEGTQIVQELRDLVQGGIQPASSTLATALGLTDADIKAAKQSSEGLFKFLMDRLQGFERASSETPKTLRGLIDQIDEAITRTGSIGMEPLQNRYKEFLQGISDALVTSDSFELNPAVIDSVREFSQEVADVASDLADIGEVAGSVVVPALKLGAEYLGVAADNTKLIAAGFAVWKGGQIASDLYNVATATNTAYQAQTLLGQAVQKVNSFYDTGRNSARLRYQEEMQAAQQAASIVLQEEGRKQQAIKQTEAVNKAFIRLANQGNIELAQQLRAAKYEYMRLGVSAEEAGRLQYQAAQQAAKGNADLTRQILQAQEAHLKAAQAANTQANGLRSMYDRAGMAAGAISILSGTMMTAIDDTDSLAYEMLSLTNTVANAAITIDILTKAFSGLKLAMFGTAGLIAAPIVGTVASLIDQAERLEEIRPLLAGVNAPGMDDIHIPTAEELKSGKWQRPQSNGDFVFDNQVSYELDRKRLVDHSAQVAAQRRQKDRQAAAEATAKANASALTINQRATDLSGVKNAAKTAEAEAKKLQQRYEKYRNQLLESEKDLETKITELTGSTFDVASAELAEEMQKVQSRITNAEVAGVSKEEIDKVKELAAAYQQLKEAQNARENVTDMHNLRMETWQAEYDAGMMYAAELNAQRETELQTYMAYLQGELQNTQLTEQEKLRLRQEYASAYTALQEAQAQNSNDIWDNALEHLKNTQLSQLETLNSGVDGMIGTLTNFGQNMLTEQKSFTERMKDLYSDLANSILNMMMKVIMQGLVMKAIMGAFGIGGSGGTISTPNFGSADLGLSVGGLSVDPFATTGVTIGIPGHAKGGYAQKGWSIVGEEGPELLDLATPGRIYNAEQTAQALRMSGGAGYGSGIENVKVEIRNESNQQMQVTNSAAQVNGRDMIISIVIGAIARNEQGSQDMIRSIAQKSG